MYVANTTAEARCLALEAELANLCDTNNHDNQKELINHFSKLEVNHLNLQLKYQNLKDSNGNNPPTPNKDTLDFDSVFVTGKMQASLQGKDNVIRQLKKQLCQLQVTHGDIDRTLRVQTTDSHITKLTDHVTHLQAQNGLFRAKNKQHYKELYDSIKITRAKHIKQVTKLTTKNVNLKTCVSKATVNPQVSARDKHAIDVEPIVPHLMKNRDAHLDYLRHLKESVETIRDIVQEAKVTVPRTSQQNGVVERRNHTLVEAAQTMLIFFKALMFLWAEAVATACYTQNRSLIHTHHHKTPYEVVHNKKPDLTFFRVFGALCYPTNDSEDLRKLQPTADTGIFVGYAPSRKGYRIYNKRTRRIMETIHVQFDELTEPMAPVHLNKLRPRTKYGSCNSFCTPTNKELEILFQLMFDEYLEPPRAERPVPPAQAEPALVNSAGTPLSNTIDQDAPTPSISPSSSALQSHSLHQGVATEPNYMEERTNAPVDNPPFVNVFAPEPHSKATSSGDISSTDSPYISQTLHHLNK
nr:hypothetical protein [Tanacetum cinerariifolium]